MALIAQGVFLGNAVTAALASLPNNRFPNVMNFRETPARLSMLSVRQMTGLNGMICEENANVPQLSVRCRAQSRASAVLPILDLSAGGFMVPFKGWAAQPGERVLATIDGFSARPSVLVWAEDGLAGIAFEELLHAAVFDQLFRKLEEVSALASLYEAKGRAA